MTQRKMKLKSTKSTSLRRPKKFRFQLWAKWLIEMYEPCKAADVGSGKGLLSYFLTQAGWAQL
ncbi:hypothetical protein JW962_01120 [Candidatus Dojkabacteria bacterium]|nr:hypothetical protein [Candidatus Dojkabacteria bacterium]